MGTEIDPSEETDATDLYGQAQSDAAVQDAIEARKDRRIDTVLNDLSMGDAKSHSDTYVKGEPKEEDVKAVFFGRAKEL